jgi:FAD/FMN-containing dehydrogenase
MLDTVQHEPCHNFAVTIQIASLPAVIERIRAVVGTQGLLTDPRDVEPFAADWRGIYRGTTPAVIRPATARELAEVVRVCAEARLPMVPQGGNTGQCNGAVPRTGGGEFVISLARLNRILDVDALNNTITAQAGCVLATIQAAAADAGRLFPLSLGAEGSCQIGGNLSTNAGGANVLRYGNARDLVLGLEVVLPDGRIWDGLRSLRKDNTGYDLKHLFIGAEGTLGIITAAVLKLFPRPSATVTAFAAVAAPGDALELLARLRHKCGDRVSAFELFSRRCLDLVLRNMPGTRDPLAERHAWYVLIELGDTRTGGALREDVEAALADAAAAKLVADAVLAESGAQREQLWKLREAIPLASRADARMVYRHDISVAVSRVPAFIAAAQAALEQAFPGIEVICFGHLGDGNLHYNAFVPGRLRADSAARDAQDVAEVVYGVLQAFGGSFSAEHGIGLAKVAQLARYKNPVELELMHALKRTLDPWNLMNPGKVLAREEG